MRVVRGSVLDRPILQRRRNCVRSRELEWFATRDGRAQCAIDRLRQTLLLRLVVEREAAEDGGCLHGRGRRAALAHGPLIDAFDGFRKSCGSHCGGLSFLDALLRMCVKGDAREKRGVRQIMHKGTSSLQSCATHLGHAPAISARITSESCNINKN